MSKRCSKCGRGAQSGNSRSHSNIASKRRFQVNLQWRHIDGARLRMCTRCLRTRTKATRAAV
ncbi:50S ribosomal protein L28 [Candidatus Uhrbacteria bacterium]|nr:50S ribosomal protein L28 [Candidatus Uhrbacteria bacterium]